jgi:diguanylate cyclase (GGDEF)-like protein
MMRDQAIARARTLAVRFAVLGTVVPVLVAVSTSFAAHRAEFFAGAAGACLAAIALAIVSRRRRFVFWAAAFGGIPSLTLMQGYTGGVISGYSVLVMMAMIWFGVDGTDVEQLLGIVLLAACCYLPMIVIGPPAYPVSWGHATLLVMMGTMVAGWLRLLTREMQTLTRRLHQEAVVDDLTGLLNRRGWRVTAPRELARLARTGFPTAVVALDLDNFKQLNDAHGHDAGDRVLRATADRIRDTLRAGDVVARLGGDEFIALLTNTTLAGAMSAIDRLREATPPREAFSAGVAVWNRREDLAELVRRADLALYDAKGAGGSRTGVAQAEPAAVGGPEVQAPEPPPGEPAPVRRIRL